MRREGEELHFETDEARAGSTPNIMRWVLGISLFGAIVLLSAIWIFGAVTRDEDDVVQSAAVAGPVAAEDRAEEAADTLLPGDDFTTEGEAPALTTPADGDLPVSSMDN